MVCTPGCTGSSTTSLPHSYQVKWSQESLTRGTTLTLLTLLPFSKAKPLREKSQVWWLGSSLSLFLLLSHSPRPLKGSPPCHIPFSSIAQQITWLWWHKQREDVYEKSTPSLEFDKINGGGEKKPLLHSPVFGNQKLTINSFLFIAFLF